MKDIYVVVDHQAQKLVGSYAWFRQCHAALKKLQDSGSDAYSWHNITPPNCPAWVKALMPG